MDAAWHRRQIKKLFSALIMRGRAEDTQHYWISFSLTLQFLSEMLIACRFCFLILIILSSTLNYSSRIRLTVYFRLPYYTNYLRVLIISF